MPKKPLNGVSPQSSPSSADAVVTGEPSSVRSGRMHAAKPLVGLLLAAALSACGGGGSATGSNGTVGSTLSLSGTAATGRALSAAPVDAVCANGAKTHAVSGVDGSFSLTVAGAVAPCMLHTHDAASGLDLYSAASPGATIANLTPLTTLIVDHALSQDASSVYATFAANPAAQQALGSAQLGSSESEVVQALQSGLGWQPASGTGSLMQGYFRAASVLAAGDAADQQLDRLAAQLAPSGASAAAALQPLIQAAAAAAPGAAPNFANLGVAPATAVACSYAVSGDYWLAQPGAQAMAQATINFGSAPLGSQVTGTATTVPAMSVLTDKGTTLSLVPDATHACEFGLNQGTTPYGVLFITRDGVGLFSAYASAPQTNPPSIVPGTIYPTQSLAMLLPVQKVAPSDLAGQWNYVGLLNGNVTTPTTSAGSWASDTGSIALGVTSGTLQGMLYDCNPGTQTTALVCPGSSAGTPWANWSFAASSGKTTADPGLFTMTATSVNSSNGHPQRTYDMAAYVAPDGNRVLMGVATSPSNFSGILVAIVHSTRFAMRSVGTPVDAIDMYLNSAFNGTTSTYSLATSIEDLPTDTLAVQAVGDTMISVDRSFQEVGQNLHLDTVWYDLPSKGMLYRPPLPATTGTTGASEFVGIFGWGWGVTDLTGIGPDGTRVYPGQLLWFVKP